MYPLFHNTLQTEGHQQRRGKSTTAGWSTWPSDATNAVGGLIPTGNLRHTCKGGCYERGWTASIWWDWVGGWGKNYDPGRQEDDQSIMAAWAIDFVVTSPTQARSTDPRSIPSRQYRQDRTALTGMGYRIYVEQ